MPQVGHGNTLSVSSEGTFNCSSSIISVASRASICARQAVIKYLSNLVPLAISRAILYKFAGAYVYCVEPVELAESYLADEFSGRRLYP